MKRIFLLIIIISLNTLNIFAKETAMTHYVTDNLRIRTEPNLSSSAITTLPKYTAVRIIETGESATIDGMTVPWVKVVSQTNYSGWCFSGYIKPIEKNNIEILAAEFAKRKDGTSASPAELKRNNENITNIKKIDEIIPFQGYYIQQFYRTVINSRYASEILKLSVQDKNVYIDEIDIINGKTVSRNRIKLTHNGTTFAHNETKIQLAGSDLQIIYSENVSSDYRFGSCDYNRPFIFAGSLDHPMEDRVRRLTTDYLKTFAGTYVFDSYKIIESENKTIDAAMVKKTKLLISYDQKKKCLTIPYHNLVGWYEDPGAKNRQWDFIETLSTDPFYWVYAEGAGFSEERFYFYKNGIVFTNEYLSVPYNYEKDDYDERRYIKYVVFFKKVN